jgi:CcmD family protein
MGALVAAYIAVWLGLSLYVTRLGVRQRHLAARVDMLASEIKHRASNTSVSDAA